MLRIKRAVQASYNTEASFVPPPMLLSIAAIGSAASLAACAAASVGFSVPLEAFVASTLKPANTQVEVEVDEGESAANGAAAANPDAIQVDEDEF
jgi:hypothetical protein